MQLLSGSGFGFCGFSKPKSNKVIKNFLSQLLRVVDFI